ncbi:MAG: RNA ligase family protein [Nannocystaceae bacterium]
MGGDFISYDRIPETTATWVGAPAQLRQLDRLRWAVTEKIHGANFCLLADGRAVRCAKRKAILREGDAFFNYERVRVRYAQAAHELFADVAARDPEVARLYIYGELFGGAYPHPEVAAVDGVAAVQTGVYYAPGIEFCAFDLAVQRRGAATRAYLDFDAALELLRARGFFVAEPLLVGTLREALDYPLGFDSTIPARLGLPALAEANPAEGVVLKPVKAFTLGEGDGQARPILKRKIAAFAEDDRFHRAEAWAEAPADASPRGRLEWLVGALVTDNRLNNALSKVGLVARGDLEGMIELEGLLVEDVREQLELLEGEALARLDADARAQLERAIVDAVGALIVARFG